MHVINSHIGSYNQGRQDEEESEILVFILMNKFDFIKEMLHCGNSTLSCRVYNSCPLFIFQHLLLWRSALDILCWFLEYLQPIHDFLSIRGWMSVILPKIFASSVTCTVYIAPIRCIRRRCGGLKRSRHHFLPSKAVSWQWGSCDASNLWPLCNKPEGDGRSDFYNLEFSGLSNQASALGPWARAAGPGPVSSSICSRRSQGSTRSSSITTREEPHSPQQERGPEQQWRCSTDRNA